MDDIKFKVKLEQAANDYKANAQQAWDDAVKKYMKQIENKISQKKILQCARNGKKELHLRKYHKNNSTFDVIKSACNKLSYKYPHLSVTAYRGHYGEMTQMIAFCLVLPALFMSNKAPINVYVTWN
jgi:hypothetical protein